MSQYPFTVPDRSHERPLGPALTPSPPLQEKTTTTRTPGDITLLTEPTGIPIRADHGDHTSLGSDEKTSSDHDPAALTLAPAPPELQHAPPTALVSDIIDQPFATDSDPVERENLLNRRSTQDLMQTNRSLESQVYLSVRRARTKEHTSTMGEAPTAIDPDDLDWDGPDDHDNPLLFPSWKKWWITYTVALAGFACTVGSSLYIGAVPGIMLHFRTNEIVAILGLCLYILGLTLGPMIGGPLLEIIGRQWVYLCLLPLGIIWCIGVGLAKNSATIIVCRFFVGFFASSPLAVAAGTLLDIWGNDFQKMSIPVVLFCYFPFLGPVVGPIMAGWSGVNKGWEWPAAWILMMIMGVVSISMLGMPETYKKTILTKRAKKRGIALVAKKFDMHKLKSLLYLLFVKPFEMMIFEPIVFFLSLYVLFIFAILFGFLEAFPFIFRSIYGFSFGVSGLTFISVGIGLTLGVVFYLMYDYLYYFPKNPDGTRGRRDEQGNLIIWFTPESKLILCTVGAFAIPISLFWLGWSGRPSVHWMAPLAAGVHFGFGLCTIFLGVVTYFAMAFPPTHVASAMSANNFLRYLMAAAFPLFVTQMFINLGPGWACSTFGFIAIAMIPVPLVFSKYGARFRASSKYGYTAYIREMTEKKQQMMARQQDQQV